VASYDKLKVATRLPRFVVLGTVAVILVPDIVAVTTGLTFEMEKARISLEEDNKERVPVEYQYDHFPSPMSTEPTPEGLILSAFRFIK
jgi:hypothetical protein